MNDFMLFMGGLWSILGHDAKVVSLLPFEPEGTPSIHENEELVFMVGSIANERIALVVFQGHNVCEEAKTIFETLMDNEFGEEQATRMTFEAIIGKHWRNCKVFIGNA